MGLCCPGKPFPNPRRSEATLPPFLLSIWIALWAGTLALILGTALAWGLTRSRSPRKWILEALVLTPLILPPTLTGYYLLVLLGQRGLGPIIERWFGFRFIFSVQGAILAATITALPLVTQVVQSSLGDVGRQVQEAARVDGASEWQVFLRISLPLAWRGLLAGGILGFLRAMGDFGTTLMIAGNIPGRTQTMAMAIYDAAQANDLARANQYALILSAVAFGLLFIAMKLRQRVDGK
jgi:molybdate transport system permease protein